MLKMTRFQRNVLAQVLFNFQLADIAQFELRSKPQSLLYGRHLYRFEYQNQFYWLKAQQQGSHPTVAEGFRREYRFYQQKQHLKHAFLLPCVLMDQEPIHIQQQEYTQALILPEAMSVLQMDGLPKYFDETKAILWQVLDAVEQLHLLGWIHADLKAEHIVQFDGKIKLLDFEQARHITDNPQQRLTATPRYMAPELFQGQPKTRQSDIYALGIIFYEWLTQQRLQASSYQDWAYLHCQRFNLDKAEHITAFYPLLKAMLAKHYSQRCANISALKLWLSG